METGTLRWPYMVDPLTNLNKIGHIWPMLKTPTELMQDIGQRIGARRKALGWTQQTAAARSSVSYRTWRRLETLGQASVEDLVKAAVALRCEEGLDGLFPPPVASSLDELLRRQKIAARRQGPPRS